MSFKKDFVWGTATASYQIEGGYREDGKGDSIWDVFSHEDDVQLYIPNNGGGFDASGKIKNGDTGDVACDHYHRYKEDVAIMKEMGLKAYRFSIAWSRIIPEGIGEINEKGVQFYRNLVEELVNSGIEPYVTLYHWDLPQSLHEKDGWLNPNISDIFAKYVKVVVDALSDKVTYWMTFNEPQIFINLGYGEGIHAPGLKCSMKERFQMAHNVMLAHGKAVQVIRQYSKKESRVGIAPNAMVMLPETSDESTVEFAKAMCFSNHEQIGLFSTSWWLDPIILGRYPEDGLIAYKDFLPDGKDGDLDIICQPLDFLGVNLYYGTKVAHDPVTTVRFSKKKTGYPATALQWPIEPETLYYMPKFLQERYNLPLYITENGMTNIDWKGLDSKVHDPQRIDFLHRYILQLKRAAEEGVDIRGYFYWSFMDNFEWNHGYNPRFGLIYVDYPTQERIWKDSAYWYKNVIESNGEIL